jgi:hypothetical protein
VAAAARLFYKVRERVFGRDFSFDTADPVQARAFDTLGTAVVPDLLSDRFEAFLGSTFGSRLKDYSGPPSRELLPAELLERDQLKFDAYVPVPMFQLALAARIFGDVRLALTVDRATGAVTAVQPVSEIPVLTAYAAPLVRGWRFTPESLTDRVEVTLRFQLRCS